MSAIGLIDANNFYVSCERAFDAKLVGASVVVASNNDGCAIARSNEAKALGVRMGDPIHLIRDRLDKHGVVVRSSNYGPPAFRVDPLVAARQPDLERRVDPATRVPGARTP